MRAYSKEDLLAKLAEISEMIGKVPTQRELRDYGITEDPYYRVFGNYNNAKQELIEGGYIKGKMHEAKVRAEDREKDGLIEQLKGNLSVDELKAVVKATGVSTVRPVVKHTQHETGHFKMLVVSDTHIGHSKFREDWWHYMVDHAVKEKVDFAYHAGDILEGMSGRPGHVYELDCIGFEAQFAKAKALIGECPFGIRGITGNHDCLSEDTEVLTNNGWKFYTELNKTDRILSYVDGNCKWDKINEVLVKETSDDLVSIKNIHIDMLVTKGHRVLHKHRASAKSGFGAMQYKPADELKGRISVPIAASYNQTKSKLTDDEIKLLGWILTDGSCKDGKGTVYQSKPYEKITRLLERLNLEYKIYSRQRTTTHICGTELKSQPLPDHTITFNCGLPDKYPFPEECFAFNDKQFEIFLEALIEGDGSYYNHTNTAWILYGVKEFLDNIQILCSMHNYRSNLSKDTRGHYRLNISKAVDTQFEVKLTKKYIPFSGKVWCLSVPETNFLVRRNGKPFFTGNCWYTGKADQGINVGLRLEESLSNFTYLGDAEADQIVENVKVKLFHGNDGGSYAISYRSQKIVESLDGGDKPHILITGHDHKSIFFQTRNVHVIGAGTLCEQTSFMRGKKLAAHRGYWIVDVWSNEEGLVRIRPEWNAFY